MMPRSRNIKPGLLENEYLGELNDSVRLLFHCLPMFADREGVIEYRPRRLLKDMWGYRSDITVEDLHGYITVISQLDNNSMLDIIKYESKTYLLIKSFDKHQHPHHTEKKGELPSRKTLLDDGITVSSPLDNGYNPSDSGFLIPDSLIPDSVQKKSEDLSGVCEEEIPVKIVRSKKVKKEPDDFQVTIAEQLADFLRDRQKRNITKSQIKSWANDIRLLMDKDFPDRESMKADVIRVMQAILDRSGEPYFPIIESGSSFREKFLKVEQNINRTKQNYEHNSKRTRSITEQTQELIAKVRAAS
jgi:hypothetical protein